MRGLLLLALLAPASRADDVRAVVEKHAAALVKDRNYAVAVVGVLADGKEQVFAFGAWDGKTPDRDSVFEIGSITKAFTGVLLAERVKAGVVRLDDPVHKHLPANWKMPRRDDRDITLLHLATHSSSLPRVPAGVIAATLSNPNNPYSAYSLEALVTDLGKIELRRPIGSKVEYSNLGAGLLGHALVHAAKAESYETLLTARVLKPLGMSNTTIKLDEGQKARLIPGYDPTGKPQHNWDFSCIEACGALRSTVGDMLRFAKANVDPAGPLKDAIVLSQQPWREVSPATREHGLCWARTTEGKKPPTIWHNGQTGGYHSFLGFVPGRCGVVVLCNVATGKVDDVGFDLIKHLVEAK